MKSLSLSLFVGTASANWGGHNHPWYWAPDKPEGWFSASMQYSPPKIQYIPAKLHKPTYSICTIEEDGLTIEIKIGQVPHYPVMIKGKIMGEVWNDADGEVWSFTVNKFGNVAGDMCANVGPEFNPLSELVYGVPNIYADPKRGAIDDVTIIDTPDDDDPTNPTEQEFSQPKFLANLGGKNSIIGKSIKATTMRMND